MGKLFSRLSQALQKNKAAALDSTPGVMPRIGELLDGRYRLEAEIGRGGMGIVYRALDIQNNRDVAIKVINFERANALTLQQFARETEISADLRHPHVVAVYDTGSVNMDTGQSLPFIVMELAQGTSLDQAHGLTYARIIDIAQQICDALDYVHNHGFVYRDLKPGNVILEKRGFHYFVKLMDFGLARPRGEAYLPSESNLAGSVFYLAPELIGGQPADVTSDLYALGVMLYELITGRVPFSDIDEQNILQQHLNAPVAPLSQSRHDVPLALEAVVLRLLQKKPADRFGSALEVREALESIALAPKTGRRGNLPEANAAGPETQVAEVISLLESHSLVTMLGEDDAPVRAAAAKVAGQFADGAWLVQLDSVREPAMVLPTVLSVLGIGENTNRPPAISLVESLQQKNQLLLLLHCDHVRAACAQLAETILRACPDVRILAASRQPLGLPGEACHPSVPKES